MNQLMVIDVHMAWVDKYKLQCIQLNHGRLGLFCLFFIGLNSDKIRHFMGISEENLFKDEAKFSL